MPYAKVRGVNIFYQVVGDQGPWAALITGGRRGHDEFIPLAQKLAKGGYRVVLHDRRNTGRSDVLIEGDVAEEIMWLDDLHELLKQLNAVPTIIGGSSAGARTAASVPITVLAPGRLSMTMLWPSARLSGADRARATVSTAPPGGNGTIKRMGRAG